MPATPAPGRSRLRRRTRRGPPAVSACQGCRRCPAGSSPSPAEPPLGRAGWPCGTRLRWREAAPEASSPKWRAARVGPPPPWR
eukprot:567218-Alexandrium_andersonii.AAC.1